MADYTSTALVQGLSIGQSVAGTVKIQGAQVMPLGIDFRFHRARGRLRVKGAAVTTSLSIGQTAGDMPGKRPTR